MTEREKALLDLQAWIEQQQNTVADGHPPSEYAMGQIDALQEVAVRIADMLYPLVVRPHDMEWEKTL